jgi:hypothetical protein
MYYSKSLKECKFNPQRGIDITNKEDRERKKGTGTFTVGILEKWKNG